MKQEMKPLSPTPYSDVNEILNLLEQIEQTIERLDVDGALHERRAQHVLHAVPRTEPDEVERPERVHALRERHPDAVLAEQADEADDLVVHGRSRA